MTTTGHDASQAGEVASLEKIDVERVSYVEPAERQETRRGLKSRHTQMIALGGTIGTGLFVGSGQALRMGGPAFLLVSYILVSAIVYGLSLIHI